MSSWSRRWCMPPSLSSLPSGTRGRHDDEDNEPEGELIDPQPRILGCGVDGLSLRVIWGPSRTQRFAYCSQPALPPKSVSSLVRSDHGRTGIGSRIAIPLGSSLMTPSDSVSNTAWTSAGPITAPFQHANRELYRTLVEKSPMRRQGA